MQKNAICECLRDDRVTALTQILKQYWKKQQYDYFDRPRPFYGLMLLLQGSVRFVFEGGELIARAGELVFLPQEARYAAIFEDEAKDYLVNFEMQGVNVPVSVPTLLFQNAPAEVRGRFADLVWAGRSGAASALKCKAQFYFLLDEIVKNANFGEQDGCAAVERAKELLAGDEERSIEEIAALCNISASGLRKKFKAREGMTLAKYRLREKIGKARYLLEATDLSLTEITDTLGFYDVPYFCKVFKRIMGVTPREFMKTKEL